MEHPQDNLLPIISYIIAAIRSHSLASLPFFLWLLDSHTTSKSQSSVLKLENLKEQVSIEVLPLIQASLEKATFIRFSLLKTLFKICLSSAIQILWVCCYYRNKTIMYKSKPIVETWDLPWSSCHSRVIRGNESTPSDQSGSGIQHHCGINWIVFQRNNC